jgi:lipid-binding SYLF domain-containing protein
MPFLLPLVCIGWLVWNGSVASGQVREENTVRESIDVLNEIMAIPINGIPETMLKDAQAVAIIPRVIKGSFVVGARRGNGVVLIRDENGGWHAPVFVTLTGGNIGWQVGVQSTDVVLVFKTRKSVDGLLSGRLTLGADAAVAAGPLGRQAAAATDSRLGAQIYSYSRSRGLFAGVSFDGSVIRLDRPSNAAYYRSATPGGPVTIPPSAEQLGMQVIRYAGNQTAVRPAPTEPSPAGQVPTQQASIPASRQILAQKYSMQEVEALRDQLAGLAPELYELLNLNWQQYLGLPAQVFQASDHPSVEILNQCLARFDAVRTDPRYTELAGRPEFQSTYGLLRHYIQALSQTQQPLNLPPPPPSGVGNQ